MKIKEEDHRHILRALFLWFIFFLLIHRFCSPRVSLRFKITLEAQTAAMQRQEETPVTYLNKGAPSFSLCAERQKVPDSFLRSFLMLFVSNDGSCHEILVCNPIEGPFVNHPSYLFVGLRKQQSGTKKSLSLPQLLSVFALMRMLFRSALDLKDFRQFASGSFPFSHSSLLY